MCNQHSLLVTHIYHTCVTHTLYCNQLKIFAYTCFSQKEQYLVMSELDDQYLFMDDDDNVLPSSMDSPNTVGKT